MREIKFRAWDKREKKMYYGIMAGDIIMPEERNPDRELHVHVPQHYNRCVVGFVEADNFILMQFTGLKDRNDKEIYHHDIIKKVMNMKYTPDCCKKYNGAIGKIMYSLWPFAGFVIELVKGPDNSFYYPDGTNFMIEELEVIGNIHQNPELLEKK